MSSGGERSLHDPAAMKEALGAESSRRLDGGATVGGAGRGGRSCRESRCRTLYLQSREDNRITSRDAERHFAMIGSAEKVQRWFTGCGHIISADYCKDEVAGQVIECSSGTRTTACGIRTALRLRTALETDSAFEEPSKLTDAETTETTETTRKQLS
jgi:hypothetical protein